MEILSGANWTHNSKVGRVSRWPQSRSVSADMSCRNGRKLTNLNRQWPALPGLIKESDLYLCHCVQHSPGHGLGFDKSSCANRDPYCICHPPHPHSSQVPSSLGTQIVCQHLASGFLSLWAKQPNDRVSPQTHDDSLIRRYGGANKAGTEGITQPNGHVDNWKVRRRWPRQSSIFEVCPRSCFHIYLRFRSAPLLLRAESLNGTGARLARHVPGDWWPVPGAWCCSHVPCFISTPSHSHPR